MALASIPVPPDARRDAAARELVKTAHTWPVFTLKRQHGAFEAGTTFRRAPGSRGASYLVNAVACECPDYQRSNKICKHIRAIVLFEASQQPASRPATETTWTPCARGCGALLAPEHIGRFCDHCAEKARRLLDSMDTQDVGRPFVNGRIDCSDIFQLNPLAE